MFHRLNRTALAIPAGLLMSLIFLSLFPGCDFADLSATGVTAIPEDAWAPPPWKEGPVTGENPVIVSFHPADGVSVGVSEPVILELLFSHPMDSRSAEDALKLDIPGEKVFEWFDDNRILRVKSDKPLTPLISYTWAISGKALSREGMPLAKEVSGCFITEPDREFLRVVKVLPLIPPEQFTAASPHGESGLWGAWIPAADGLEQGPGSGHGIGVAFNKPPESESLRRAFNFTPPLPGRVEILSPVSAVFIPAKDPEPGTVYCLRISGDLKDEEGFKMGDDYVTTFTPDIPFLYVSLISVLGGEEKIEPGTGIVLRAPINQTGHIKLFITFSLMFDTKSPVVQECVYKISLSPIFPSSLSPAGLCTAMWFYLDMLYLEWKDLEGGDPGQFNYYTLVIPGGTGGIQNGKGAYLKEDLVLYLEVYYE
jgi:hypothetical protein